MPSRSNGACYVLILALALAGCAESGGSGGKRATTTTGSAPPGGSTTASGSSGTGSTSTPSGAGSQGLRVGVAAVEITPPFEGFHDQNNNGERDRGEPFYDTGTDRLYSPAEPGYDPATNPDPHGDDYHPTHNPDGTENNGDWERLVLAGFGGFITFAWLTGTYRYATEVHDSLWARTLVLEKAGETVVLQSLDLVGVLHVDVNLVKRRVERELGIPFHNIIIASTHCHSGPDVVGMWSGRIEYEYLAFLRERMFESVEQAVQALEPTEMRSVSVEPAQAAYDRQTLLMKTGPQSNFGHPVGNFAPTQDEAENAPDAFLLQIDLRDPFLRNTEIAAMGFYRPGTQEVIATLVNWHDHPEVLTSKNLMISSDFPHFLRQRVEQQLGGTCVYFSGTVGGQIGALEDTPVPARDVAGHPIWAPGVFDVQGNPFPQLYTTPSLDKIRSLGFVVADEAVAALQAAPTTVNPLLRIRTEDLEIDLENPLLQTLARFINNRRDKDPQDQLLVRPYFHSPIGGTMVQLSVVDIGDAQIVTAPGEVFPDHWRGRPSSQVTYWGFLLPASFPAMPSIRDEMTGRDRFIFGLANTYLGYLVPESDSIPLALAIHPNYYEEIVSAGPNFGDNVGNKLLQMLGSSQRFSSYPIRP